MSRPIRVERLPSGIHFNAPPKKTIYQPEAEASKPKNVRRNVGKKPPRIPEIRPYEGPSDNAGVFNLFTLNKGFTRPSPVPPYVVPYYPPSQSPYDSEEEEPVTPIWQPPAPQPKAVKLCLPLLEVSVEVQVDGTIARTTLVQRFSNKSEEPIPEAHYTFPLYDGAVVTSFCLSVEGRVLVGQVKPKDEAQDDFKKAVEHKKVAALLEEHTPEVFETAVGNIPAKSVVEVKMTYVNELRVAILDGRKEGLDVVIPMSIAPRYGKPPDAYPSPPELEGHGLHFEIYVNNNGTVADLTSASGHGIEVNKNFTPKSIKVSSIDELVKQPETAITQAVARYESSKAMREDFVVTIETKSTYLIRSRAVLSPTNKQGHAALMVNIKPAEVFKKDAQPEKFKGEIIFVLDRSGSMGWTETLDDGTESKRTKIGTLRNALPLSLASLPDGCAFNIISFGTDCEFMWPESRPSTGENRQFARTYASKVKSNMGGTRLLFALQEAVKSRLQDRGSTQIIAITDGEVEEDGIIEFVAETRRALEDGVRFFALGIGTQVSHRLIPSIGEFGGGYGEIVNIMAQPRWEGAVIRMLEFGVMPATWTCDIDLGPGFERQSLLSYGFEDKPRSEEEEEEEEEKKSVPYIQGPYPTPPLHPYAYRSIFFLLDIGTGPTPQAVTLRATNTAGRKTRDEHPLTVEPTWTDASTIHHLAAKAVLVSLEAEMKQGQPSKVQSETARQNAEKLGVMYSITSKWTSFVALDRETEEKDEIAIVQAEMDDTKFRDLLNLGGLSDSASVHSSSSSGSVGSADGEPESPTLSEARARRGATAAAVAGAMVEFGAQPTEVERVVRDMGRPRRVRSRELYELRAGLPGPPGPPGPWRSREMVIVEERRVEPPSPPSGGTQVFAAPIESVISGEEEPAEETRERRSERCRQAQADAALAAASMALTVEESEKESEPHLLDLPEVQSPAVPNTSAWAPPAEDAGQEASVPAGREEGETKKPNPAPIQYTGATQPIIPHDASPMPASEAYPVSEDLMVHTAQRTPSPVAISKEDLVVGSTGALGEHDDLTEVPEAGHGEVRSEGAEGTHAPDLAGHEDSQSAEEQRSDTGLAHLNTDSSSSADIVGPSDTEGRSLPRFSHHHHHHLHPLHSASIVGQRLDAEGVSDDDDDEDDGEDDDDINVANGDDYGWETEEFYDTESEVGGHGGNPMDKPITWQDAVAAQDDAGMFQLASVRERLQHHFCPGAAAALAKVLETHGAHLSEEKRAAVVDTLMMVRYFKTHAALEEDLWGMIVRRAEFAVLRALYLSGEAGEEGEEDEGREALASVATVLEWSIRHAHFLPDEEWPEGGRPGPFPPSGTVNTCPVCGTASSEVSGKAAAAASAPKDGGQSGGLGSAQPRCPFEGCEMSTTRWDDWDELWRHQVENGHVVCRKTEWFGNLEDEFESD